MKPLNTLQQWQKQEAERQAQAKPSYDTFDAYVKDFPEAEQYRKWVGDGIMLPTYPNWCGMPGDYITASVHHWHDQWHVVINDCDDGTCQKHFPTEEQAREELNTLKTLSPLVMYDLRDFGYDSFN